NRERGVVLQEIRMVEDTPDDLVHDLIAEKIWNGGSYGSPILGTKKTVEEMGRESVLEYYKENYQAKKMLVTIAGGLKTTKVVKLLEASLGSVVSGEDKKPSKTPASASGSKLVKRDLEQVHLCLGVPAVSQAHPHRFRYYLLNTILGGGMSSRLFQEIREKRGLAYSIYSYLSFSEKAGSLVVYAGTSSEEFKGVLRLIIREFGKVGKDISRAELKAAKDHLKGGMLLGLESSDSRMMKLARDEIYFGKSISIKEIVSGIDKVRGSDIKKTAKEIFKPKNLTLVAIGKGKSEDLPKYLRG
ncbi:MAG: insulinase family protein, partial [Deltaproteobacteria bacterium]|nr:insulinase family protein [Deltaproteobacteria bacterium]